MMYYILSSGTISMYALESVLHVGYQREHVYDIIPTTAKSMSMNITVNGVLANACAMIRRMPIMDRIVHIKRIC